MIIFLSVASSKTHFSSSYCCLIAAQKQQIIDMNLWVDRRSKLLPYWYWKWIITMFTSGKRKYRRLFIDYSFLLVESLIMFLAFSFAVFFYDILCSLLRLKMIFAGFASFVKAGKQNERAVQIWFCCSFINKRSNWNQFCRFSWTVIENVAA